MKKRYCILAALFIAATLVGCTAPAAKDEAKAQSAVETKIDTEALNAKLQSYFHEFYAENDKYTHKESEYQGVTAESHVDGYFNGNELERMKFSFITDDGSEEYQCYFIDTNDIYFVRNVIEHKKANGNKSEEQDAKEMRYMEQYFIVNDKLVTYKNGKAEYIDDQNSEILKEVKIARSKIMEPVN